MKTKSVMRPEDLPRRFVECANAGDLEGLVALYEPDAVVNFPAGRVTRGHDEIRAAYKELLAQGRTFGGEPRAALYAGDFALTSSRLPTGAITVEVAHRQPDGSWRWIIDQPNVVEWRV